MCKTKKNYKYIIIILFSFFLSGTAIHPETDKDIFDKTRLALFDRQWDKALTEIERLEKLFPNSSYKEQLLFYKGKCWEEKKNPGKALESYSAFMTLSTNDSLKEEAARSVIDLNFDLYQTKNQRNYLNPIIRFLKSNRLAIQYYAAFKLSYIKNKPDAELAVPVLKKITAAEKDDELVERAKIALMRIDPKLIKNISSSKSLENRMLAIQVYEKKSRRTSFTLRIPFAFARLALQSIPEKERGILAKEGYNIDQILDTLTRNPEIISIDAEDIRIKIWIE